MVFRHCGGDQANPCGVNRRAILDGVGKRAGGFRGGYFVGNAPAGKVVSESRAVGWDAGDGKHPAD